MEWRVIEGTEGSYSVSDSGEVRRNSGLDSIGRRVRQRILKQAWNPRRKQNYVNLCVGGLPKVFIVSRLVAKAFLKPNSVAQDSVAQVRHIDGNKRNNHYQNLRYVSDNIGENNGFSKLTDKDIVDIKSWAADGRSTKWICQNKLIDRSTARRIITGKRWANTIYGN